LAPQPLSFSTTGADGPDGVEDWGIWQEMMAIATTTANITNFSSDRFTTSSPDQDVSVILKNIVPNAAPFQRD
jgi:hypothetical protein